MRTLNYRIRPAENLGEAADEGFEGEGLLCNLFLEAPIKDHTQIISLFRDSSNWKSSRHKRREAKATVERQFVLY